MREKDDGPWTAQSMLAVLQWLALFCWYNQSGHGTWPGRQEVSTALVTGAGTQNLTKILN